MTHQQRGSLIIESRNVSAEWLAKLLPPLLFGAEYELMWHPEKRDLRPVRITWDGEREHGEN